MDGKKGEMDGLMTVKQGDSYGERTISFHRASVGDISLNEFFSNNIWSCCAYFHMMVEKLTMYDCQACFLICNWMDSPRWHNVFNEGKLKDFASYKLTDIIHRKKKIALLFHRIHWYSHNMLIHRIHREGEGLYLGEAGSNLSKLVAIIRFLIASPKHPPQPIQYTTRYQCFLNH